MGNFCSNCGAKIKGKFCTRCGATFAKASASQARYWRAKEIDSGDGYGSNIKGSLALGENEIIFYRNKFFSGKTKESRKIPIRGIESIYRTRILNIITIKYNRKPEKTGFFSRIFNSRRISYKINDWQSFIQNIKSLNTDIKIKV